MRSKLFLILFLSLIFTACEDMQSSIETEIIKEINSCLSDDTEYASGSFTFENHLHEQYQIEYQEEPGFPDTGVYFVIYAGKTRITGYPGGDFKYLAHVSPKEILFLCDGLYYMRDDYQSYLLTENGKININADQEHFSELLKEHWNINDLVDAFQICDYDYESIVSLYNLT